MNYHISYVKAVFELGFDTRTNPLRGVIARRLFQPTKQS
jgi:hypothetical protein